MTSSCFKIVPKATQAADWKGQFSVVVLMFYGYFWCEFPEKWLFSNSKNSCMINVHIEPSSRSLLPLLLFRGTFALQPSSGKHPGMQFDQTPSSTCRFLGPSMYLGKLLLFQTWSKGIWVGIPLLFATFWGDLRWGFLYFNPLGFGWFPRCGCLLVKFFPISKTAGWKKSEKIPRTKK